MEDVERIVGARMVEGALLDDDERLLWADLVDKRLADLCGRLPDCLVDAFCDTVGAAYADFVGRLLPPATVAWYLD